MSCDVFLRQPFGTPAPWSLWQDALEYLLLEIPLTELPGPTASNIRIRDQLELSQPPQRDLVTVATRYRFSNNPEGYLTGTGLLHADEPPNHCPLAIVHIVIRPL